MHEDKVTENRINRELSERIRPAEITWRVPLEVTASHLAGEPVSISELDPGSFDPIAPGTPWGRPWGTTWFHAAGEVPTAAPNAGAFEVAVDIGYSGAMAGFQTEATIYSDGRIRCGVHPRRREIPLELITHGGVIDFLAEASANPNFSSSFRPNPLGDLSTAGSNPLYVFGGIDLVEFQPNVRRLRTLLATMRNLMQSLPHGSARKARLLRTMAIALDALDYDDLGGTVDDANRILSDAFAIRGAPDAHRLHAVGHAHIDTAWLWPIRETKRKCARTFANQVRLLEEYPEHLFAASQAAQYDFVQAEHPELFADIAALVHAGRWIPVGGMWVEADMNLPSGESIARQLIYGQRYFEEHFSVRCREIWIPDVFGYPGTLPQIFRAGGCDRFLTQKLSWNKQNRFPHHSFVWEGTDGSSVLAHFPPVETYNCELSANELNHAARNFADSAWSENSLVPFGYGDGGGGPTASMLERGRLLGDTSGAPRLNIDAPSAFFDELAAEIAQPGTPRWRGELYFEMHRGTFTSQSRTKVGNRRCENLLREAELWAATAGTYDYAEEFEALWKRVLLQQFHDIIPGSSIAWVHSDAEAEHAAVAERLEQIIDALLARLAPAFPVVANPAAHARREVVRIPAGVWADTSATELGIAPTERPSLQSTSDGSTAVMLEVAGFTTAAVDAVSETDSVTASTTELSNGSVTVRFDESGEISSIFDRRFAREVLPQDRRAATLLLAADHPVEYDAWDLEEWTAPQSVVLPPSAPAEVIDSGPLVGSVRTRHDFGSSTVLRTLTLRAGSARVDVHLDIDWHEDEKLLSIDFPVDVRTDSARCEAQFGYLTRPTHRNTSWDAAKFEVCAHRWVDLAEPEFGVAVLNDGRYGHGVQDGGIRVSLLRAPRYPDPHADRGHHEVTVAVLAHGPSLAEVVCEAEALNNPLRVHASASAPTSRAASYDGRRIVSVPDRRVGVSAVKLADDGSGDLVLRVWEATGDRVSTTLKFDRAVLDVGFANLLEEPLVGADRRGQSEIAVSGDTVALEMRPFELVTLRVRTEQR